jgi:hypothetical protein
MRKIILVLFVAAMLIGCGRQAIDPTTGKPEPYVSCTDAVSYIVGIDAALNTLVQAFPDQKQYQMAKAWYLVARTGAVAFLQKQCPDLYKNLPGVPNVP